MNKNVPDIDGLPAQTEEFDPRYKGIDTWPDDKVLRSILSAQERAVTAIGNVIPELSVAAGQAADRLKSGEGRIIYMGAGTSARLGVQDGTELTPTYGWPDERLAFVIAGGERALFQAVEGAEDCTETAEEEIGLLDVTDHDVCVAVSASGRTPYTVAACKAARKLGALTIGLANNPGAPLLTSAEHGILLDSGAEPIGGSTRMSAGTAQKVALNMISTLIMIRLGHVYDGYMVDMLLNNEKLKSRAKSMVSAISNCTEEEAAQCLDKAGGHIKLAVLVAKGIDADTGQALLEQCGGNLRTALKNL